MGLGGRPEQSGESLKLTWNLMRKENMCTKEQGLTASLKKINNLKIYWTKNSRNVQKYLFTDLEKYNSRVFQDGES